MRYVLFAALLAGCAAPTWQHPTNSPEAAAKDRMECDLQATTAAAAIVNPFDQAYAKHEITRKCLRARGYTQSSAR